MTIKKHKPSALKGTKIPEERKKRIALAHVGMKASDEARKNMSKVHKGIHYSPKTEYKKGELAKNWNGFKKGTVPWNYKGGVSKFIIALRTMYEYSVWRGKIFKLNDYTCQKCNKKGGDLIAHHHRKSFSKMRREFLELNNQFSPIEDKELLIRIAQNYAPFWDLNNGITMCVKCHKEYHVGDQS